MVPGGHTMNFAFTPEQDMLRQAARAYLEDKVPLPRVREIMETEERIDRAVWADVAGMGWLAMAIPERFGGAGYGFVELGIVMEELGRALTPVPFLSTVLVAELILARGNEAQQATYLPLLGSGEMIGALAVVEEGGAWDAAPATTARVHGDTIAVTGEKFHVLDGHVADLFVVAARGEEGTDLVLVPAATPGVTASRVETMDQTRPQATVTFDVEVPLANRLGAPGTGASALERLYDRAVTALAFEQVGGAQRCMEMSVAYAKERYQFGRPIGSFQAVKHMCADMLVAVESARSAAYYAGWAASADEEELRVVAPVAASYCSEAYFQIAANTIQVHGGIGFTWEHDAHLFFKRAKTDELLFGTPARWRATLADRLGL